MSAILRRLLCRFGWHKSLDVIQTFGAAQHVGCPDCGRQFGIHHSERACIPWDADLADMYTRFGFDIKGPLARWQAYRTARQFGRRALTPEEPT
jgi:hypothetical protein